MSPRQGQGYIKDWRQELDSAIWGMPPLYHRVWQWLKYSVNHKENPVPMRDGTEIQVGPGQRITSLRQIAQGVGWYERGIFREPNPKTIKAVLTWLEAQDMITLSTGTGRAGYTMITITNYTFYQRPEGNVLGNSQDTRSNTDCDDVSEDATSAKVTAKVTLGKQCADTNKNEKNDKKKVHTLILEHWNRKGIVEHRALTDKLTRKINGCLKDKFSEKEICTAIDNYAEILKKDEYYWQHTWTLIDFLARGLDKFADWEVCANNYRIRDQRPSSGVSDETSSLSVRSAQEQMELMELLEGKEAASGRD